MLKPTLEPPSSSRGVNHQSATLIFVGVPLACSVQAKRGVDSMAPELNATDKKVSVLLFRVGKGIVCISYL
jgi:hypothetical protein